MRRMIFFAGIFVLLALAGMVSVNAQTVDYDFSNNSYAEITYYSSSILLEVHTGSVNGKCRYSDNENFYYSVGNSFDLDFGSIHQKTLTGLSPGVYSYYVKCVEYPNNYTQEPKKLTISLRINPPVTAQIVLSDDAPLKAGRIDVTLITSKPVSPVPLLEYSFDGLVYDPITLTGEDENWRGYLVIGNNVGDGLVSFKFRAKDLEGREGTEITSGASYAIDTVKPRTVSAITAEGYDGRVELKWHFDGDYDEFNIYRSTSENPTYTDFYDSTNDEDFTDNSVSDGKTYYYKVSVVDDAGNEGDLSIEVFATPSSGSSSSSGLALNLRGSVDSLLNEIDFALGEVEDISDSVSGKSSKERELFSNLKFDAEIQRAITELKSLRNDVEKFKLQDLTKDSLDQKISSSRLKIDVIKKKIPEDITILEEGSKKEVFQEDDIREAILEADYSLDDSVVDKSVKQTLDMIKTYPLSIDTDFYIIEVMYSDASKQDFTVVSKDISSEFEKSDNGYFVEVIPKDVIVSASDIDVKNINYDVLNEDPVLSFGPDTKSIFYSFEGESDIDTLKSIKTSFVSIAEEETGGNALTGYFLYDLGKKQYTWIIIGAVLILAIGGYLFYRRRNKFSDSYFRLKKKIEDVYEILRNGDIESAQREYKTIRDFYGSLNEDEKRAIYSDVDTLRNKIFIFKLERGIRELKKTKDKNLLAGLDKIYNSLSPSYKNKIEKVFLQVKKDFEMSISAEEVGEKTEDKKTPAEKTDVEKGGEDVSK